MQFSDYCRKYHHNYIFNWHFDVFHKNLQDVFDGVINRLMILTAPRHGKSQHCSELFPTYWLGEKKDRQKILTITSTQDLSTRFGRNSRRIIDSPEWTAQYGKELSIDTAAKADFILTDQSEYLCSGRKGRVYGSGGDLILVDDLIKDLQDSRSPAIFEQVYYFYRLVVESRVEDEDTPIVIINTRWGSNDLPGTLMKEEPGEWRIVVIPAIGKVDTTYEGTKGRLWFIPADTALWPKRDPKQRHGYGIKYLKRRRKILGSLFEGMYQQDPQDMAGDLFRREDWKYYSNSPDSELPAWPDDKDIKIKGLSVDTAFKENEENDYTVIGSWAITYDGRFMMRDVIRERMRFSKLRKALEVTIKNFKPNYTLIEDTGAGTSLIQEIEDDKKLSKITVVEGIRKEKDKIQYAQSIAYLVELGVVYLPEDANWIYPWLDETGNFPKVDHDDQVDMLTQALLWCRDNNLLFGGMEEDDDEDTGISAI